MKKIYSILLLIAMALFALTVVAAFLSPAWTYRFGMMTALVILIAIFYDEIKIEKK